MKQQVINDNPQEAPVEPEYNLDIFGFDFNALGMHWKLIIGLSMLGIMFATVIYGIMLIKKETAKKLKDKKKSK